MTALVLMLLMLITVLSIVIIGLTIALIRFVKRCFQYDDLFEMVNEEIDTNIKYFDKLASTPLLSNAPEVVKLSNDMKIMRNRFSEYVLRSSEASLKNKDKISFEQPPLPKSKIPGVI